MILYFYSDWKDQKLDLFSYYHCDEYFVLTTTKLRRGKKNISSGRGGGETFYIIQYCYLSVGLLHFTMNEKYTQAVIFKHLPIVAHMKGKLSPFSTVKLHNN